MRQNYYIRFRTDTDTARVYFDLYRTKTSARPLHSLECNATGNASFYPWAIANFADITDKARARLLELSSAFELACACWVDCLDYAYDSNPEIEFNDWLDWQDELGRDLPSPAKYITQDATADEIAEHAKHYNDCLEQAAREFPWENPTD